MKTEWDYSNLADAYLKRASYSDAAIDAMLLIAGRKNTDRFCDVGAGVAHLTIMLAEREMNVVAVEPNDEMRANGIKRTQQFTNVTWHEGTGEQTGQLARDFDMVTFGSSFNVCDRQLALKETARILKPGGWFACMWNHRDLVDPIQARIETIINTRVAGYGYGARREDQTTIIDDSGLFGPVIHLSSRIIHEQPVQECVEAWHSHATLERQSGNSFKLIVSEIEGYLSGLNTPTIPVPYRTNIWIAQLHASDVHH